MENYAKALALLSMLGSVVAFAYYIFTIIKLSKKYKKIGLRWDQITREEAKHLKTIMIWITVLIAITFATAVYMRVVLKLG